MNAIERLKRDHTILRAKLDILETAVWMGPGAWYVLRELCFTLARQLQDHIRREEALVAACRKTLDPRILATIDVDHHDEPRQLRTINRLFLEASNHSLTRLRPALLDVILRLRRHMDDEESGLFPILERTVEDVPMPAVERRLCHTDETMTVNRVVGEFPATKPVFDRLFINLAMEGCDCLDEVAWRHGVDAKDLVVQLDQAIDSCRCILEGTNRIKEMLVNRTH